MFNTNVTTDSLVKPLVSMIDKLQKHFDTQKENAATFENTIVTLKEKKAEALLDAEKAANIVKNLQKLMQ